MHQHPLGKIYHCIGVVDDFVVLPVRVLNGSLQDQIAVIQGIGWHSKHQKLIFILYAQHKRRSRWYFAEDIAPALV